MMQTPRKILVLGPSWVGDMVLAHSMLQVLKQQYPDAIIDVAAPPWTMPLLARMPEVRKGTSLPFKHGELALWQRLQFGRSLRQEGYQQAILLVNSLKSAIVPWAAGITQRTGFLGEMRYGLLNDIRPLDKAQLPRTVDRFVALAMPPQQSLPAIPQPKLLANPAQALAQMAHFGRDASHPVLGLCPGAEYGEAKRWPIEYYAQVAQQALLRGWQVWLFGSDKDIAVTQSINQLTQNKCLDLGGKTKLEQAIDLMSLCHSVISNDSGLMHVAAALDKKVIAIYGSSDPKHTPPMQLQAVIEYLGLACSPCFARSCGLASDKLACLKQISPSQVMRHLF